MADRDSEDTKYFTIDAGAVLDLGKVVDNGNFVLRAFRVKSTCSKDLIISLGSDRVDEVHFQLHNENLGDSDVMAADGAPNNYNELFNTVDWIESVCLPAFSEIRIIMVFLPRVKGMRSDHGQEGAQTLQIKGTIFVRAIGNRDSSISHEADAMCSEDSMEVAVQFSAQVCQSWLTLQGSEIVFSGCTPGGTYYRDFTVKNLSEIPLYFNLELSEEAAEAVNNKTLELSDNNIRNIDGDSDFGGGSLRDGLVKSHGQLRIRTTFKPKVEGQYRFVVIFENLNNTRNRETVKMMAFVTDEDHEEGLEVSIRMPGMHPGCADDAAVPRPQEQILDFGNCFTGVGQRRILTIKNVTKIRMNVFLSSDAENEVRFDLDNDLADSESEEEDVIQAVASPPKKASASPLLATSVLTDRAAVRSSETGAVGNADDAGSDRLTTTELPRSGQNSDGVSGSEPVRCNSQEDSTDSVPVPGPKRQKNLSQVETRHRRIEELDLMPDQVRSVIVWYCPSLKSSTYQSSVSSRPTGSTYDKDLASLHIRNFQVVLKTAYLADHHHIDVANLTQDEMSTSVDMSPSPNIRSRKFISARAKVCTAFIEASKEVNLGDCTIGSSTRGYVLVRNLSELPCTIHIEFSSKILKLSDSQISSDGKAVIPPLTMLNFQLEISPMRINPGYCKQITIMNVANRLNDQFVNLRANNVDSNRVSLHALFYQVCSENSSNMISFHTLVTNSPMIRTFTLKNITGSEIILELTPSLPDAMKIFIERESSSNAGESKHGFGCSLKPRVKDRKKRVRRGIEKVMRRVSDIVALEFSRIPSNGVNISGFCKPAPGSVDESEQITAVKQLLAPTSEFTVRGRRSRSYDSQLVSSCIADRSRAVVERVNRVQQSNTQGEVGSSTTLMNTQGVLPQRPGKDATPGNSQKGKSRMPWQTVKERFERPSHPTSGTAIRYFNTVAEEVNYVKSYCELKTELARVIDEGVLTPVTQVKLPPQALRSLVLVYAPRNLPEPLSTTSKDQARGRLRSLESHIDIKMLEYDQNMLEKFLYHRGRLVNYSSESAQGDAEGHIKIPVRCLPVTAKVCESVMEVAQQHINFGTLYVNQDCKKKLVIKNLSDVPLLYRIVKTQNWASNEFMNFDGDEGLGFIKPHGHHERDFIFTPKISLKFKEELRIENLQNPENTIKLLIKAIVRKRETLALNPSSIDFGQASVQAPSKSKRFELYNLTSSSRTVLIKVSDLSFTQIEMPPNSLTPGGSVPSIKLHDSSLSVYFAPEKCTIDGERVNREEELERMERKLKIYLRKGKASKAEKLRQAIQALQGDGSAGRHSGSGASDTLDESSSLNSSPSGSDYSSADESDAEEGTIPRRPIKVENALLRSGQCIVNLVGKGLQTITVSITPTPAMISGDGQECRTSWEHLKGVIKGKIIAHETSNRDSEKSLEFWVEYLPAAPMEGEKRPVLSSKSVTEEMITSGSDDILKSGVLRDGKSIIVRKSEASSEMNVEPSLIELDDIYISEPFESSFVVQNKSKTSERNFVVMNLAGGKKKEPKEDGDSKSKHPQRTDLFKFTTTSGRLEPNGRCRVNFSLLPETKGRQSHTIIVRDITSNADYNVTVSFTARKREKESSAYVRFPEVEALDLGDCYIAPKEKMLKGKYIKTVPMNIESVHTSPLLVSVKSNLANQILIFTDSDLTKPAENIDLLPERTITVYICMLAPVEIKKEQPSSAGLAFEAIQRLWEEYNKGVSRELVVGITVDVLDPQSQASIVQKGLQLKGRIGKSILKVTTSANSNMIDFGVSRKLGQTFTSSFTISNLSDFLPLRFAVAAPPGMFVSETGGELDGRKKSEGKSSIQVDVSFRCTEYGLYFQPLKISNLSANQYFSAHEEVHEIFIQHFADEGILRSFSAVHCDRKEMEGPDVSTVVHLVENYAVPSFFEFLDRPRVDTVRRNTADGIRSRSTSPSRSRIATDKVEDTAFVSVGSKDLPSVSASSEGLVLLAAAESGPSMQQRSHLPLGELEPSRVDYGHECCGNESPEAIGGGWNVQIGKQHRLAAAVRLQQCGLRKERILLINTSAQTLVVRPRSHCDLLVYAGSPDQFTRILDTKLRALIADTVADNDSATGTPVPTADVNGSWSKGASCALVGEAFDVPPSAEVEVWIAALPSPRMIRRIREKTMQQVVFEGSLLFTTEREAVRGAQVEVVIHRVQVHGWWCESRAITADSGDGRIDVGKVGHVNRWEPVSFGLKVTNAADIPLLLTAHISSLKNCVNSTSGSGVDSSTSLEVGGSSEPKEDEPLHDLALEPSSYASLGVFSGDFEAGDLLRVEPHETREIRGTLTARPERRETAVNGVSAWQVCLQNVYNSGNQLVYTVCAHVITTALLRFDGRRLDHDDESGRFQLELPELTLPAAKELKANEWFTVTNASDEVLELHAEVILADGVADVLSVDMLFSSTSTHVHALSLKPREQSQQILIVAKGLPTVHAVPSHLMPPHSPNDTSIPTPSTSKATAARVLLGRVVLKSPSFPEESMELVGSIVQGSTISVEPAHLVLSDRQGTRNHNQQQQLRALRGHAASRSGTLQVRSLCGAPVNFAIRKCLPAGLDAATVTVEPDGGTVNAHETITVHVTVVTSDNDDDVAPCEVLGKLELLVEDQELVRAGFPMAVAVQKVTVDLEDEASRGTGKAGSSVAYRSGLGSSLPVLVVTGCNLMSAASNRYEINWGQEGCHQGKVERSFALECHGDRDGGPVRFRITPLPVASAAWLEVKTSEGVVRRRDGKETVHVQLSTDRVGLYSAYLWVENLANPFDSKAVRVAFEVLGTLQPNNKAQSSDPAVAAAAGSFWFTVFAGPPPTGASATEAGGAVSERSRVPVVDMGQLFYGTLYNHRYFVIKNESVIPLDFAISSSLEPDSASELDFSTTYNVLRRQTTVSVQPLASIRVYIFYRPGLRHGQVSCPGGERVEIEVNITCRMIKDHQKVLRYKAVCVGKKLAVPDHLDLLFSTNVVAPTLPTARSFATTPGIATDTLCTTPITPWDTASAGRTQASLGEGGSTQTSPHSRAEESPQPALAAPPAGRPAQVGAGCASAGGILRRQHFEPDSYVVPLGNLSAETLHVTICNSTQFFKARLRLRDAETVPAAPAPLVRRLSDNIRQWPSAPAAEPEQGPLAPVVQAAVPLLVDDETISIPPGCWAELEVSLNPEQLANRSRVIYTYRYFQEWIQVYNRGNLAEMHHVQCRLGWGSVVHFTAPPGSHSSWTYSHLEESLLTLLQQYNALWHRVVSGPLTSPDLAVDWTAIVGGDAAGAGAGVGEEGPRNQALEEATQGILTAVAASQPLAERQDFSRLAFTLHHIIDRMVLFGLRDQGSSVTHLVGLLFSVLFRHESFSPFITLAAEVKRTIARRKAKRRDNTAAAAGLATAASAAAAAGAGEESIGLTGGTGVRPAAEEGEGSEGGWRGKLLPPPLSLIVQQLTYLVSFFPDLSSDSIRHVRAYEADLRRLMRGDVPSRDSEEYSRLFAPFTPSSDATAAGEAAAGGISRRAGRSEAGGAGDTRAPSLSRSPDGRRRP